MDTFVWSSHRIRVYKHLMTTKQQIYFTNHRYRSASWTTIENTWRQTIKTRGKTLYIYSGVGNLLFRYQLDTEVYLLPPPKNRCIHMRMNTFVDHFKKIIIDSKQRNSSLYVHLDHVFLIYSISQCMFCIYN